MRTLCTIAVSASIVFGLGYAYLHAAHAAGLL